MKIVTAEEMYAIDYYTIQTIGMSEEALMENAGQAVCRVLLPQLKISERIAILAGTGNNGGDGFVIARILKSHQFHVDLWLIPPREKISGAAKKHLQIYENSGYSIYEFQPNETNFYEKIPQYSVIIDALLGIGVKGKLRSPYKEIIEKMNESPCTVFAIDVPSGVQANGGHVHLAVKATQTITIQNPKVAAYTFPAANYIGEQTIVDIGIPPLAIEKSTSVRMLWEKKNVQETLPKRERNSHKGDFGKGLIIGGSRELPGAVTMAAKAAIRSGAGLITTAIPEEIYPVVASNLPESMYLPYQYTGVADFAHLDLDAIAIGPGLGRSQGAKELVEQVLQMNVPIVLDADALFHLKKEWLLSREKPTILTPHAGEMARLLNSTVDEVENNRFETAKKFAESFGVYLVLKGPYTIVTTPSRSQFVNTTGNPALAKGGSGDVLTGIILAFLMQHEKVQEAISNAVYLHGAVADFLIEMKNRTEMDCLATDVIDQIPEVLYSLGENFQA